MNKICNKDVVRELAGITGYTQKSIREVLIALEEVIKTHAKKDESVKALPSITFKPVHTAQRTGRNVFENKQIIIPSRRAVRVHFAAAFRDEVQD